MTRNPATAMVTLLLVALLTISTARAQTGGASPPATAPAPQSEPTLLSVADEYVKVVGGAITALGAVLGFPLVRQTYRKTRAEITKMDLEAAKLRKELGTVPAPSGDAVGEEGHRIFIDGAHNTVSILTDPRWAAPLLVLVDAFIASVFLAVASFAIDAFPLPDILAEPTRLIVYLAIFYPVFRAARQVKKSLGAELRSKPQPTPALPETAT